MLLRKKCKYNHCKSQKNTWLFKIEEISAENVIMLQVIMKTIDEYFTALFHSLSIVYADNIPL